MQGKKELVKAWVDALRSGKYKQGTGQLLDCDNRYCCLGVACDIHPDYEFYDSVRHHPSYLDKKRYVEHDACYLPADLAASFGLCDRYELPESADAGKLIYLVGGRAETLAKVENILLSAGGSTIHHVGDVGQGMAMKLAVNALFGIQVAALAEIVGMLAKNGVEMAKAFECLSDLPVISPAARIALSLMLADKHAPLFPIDLVEKDFRYVTETASAVDALTPASSAIRDIYSQAIASGFGGENITGVIKLFI